MWEYAKKKEFKLNLSELIKFGRDADKNTLLMSAVFLQKELPIRLGKRIQELQSLPVPMYSTKAVTELAMLYEESFFRILNHEVPRHSRAEESFSAMLIDIKEKHRMVQANIADGFLEMNRAGVPKWAVESDEIQQLLNRFYTGRIGIRLLIDQHLSLRIDARNRPKRFVGCVQTECNIKEVILDAVADARSACRMHLRDAPNVYVEGMTEVTAPYIPEHLYIMLFEILKNSMRATVELHGRLSNSHSPKYGDDLPPTKILISGGQDTYVKITDRGGGIPPQSLDRIWNFSFSTAPQVCMGMLELSGFGHGLPLSRLYARYWGGDITLFSMENLGVDCYVRLGSLSMFPCAPSDTCFFFCYRCASEQPEQ
ncbi:hypothetical protein GUITHDRAFT_63012 [Guillardia theta CCMP2712]|uniref:Protein-serine/threonine kinase n=1 Tax=Guillardia theta (strain CCMP2712) TaxID=905079 RepID=L1K237_GUITC|nr:hypothetical protein GUITHDRAFT_63012 [Guillardia theta CCMP2712]EKX54886.1 hypothetical protein GUITHDRAFT_63012 [Guillardia theta CCMP2712]|eukprot:XP_005841866.1 hypothetical protein GUITHDRAFT_63012 [Guillardia theta CCMP2712]